MKNIKLQMCCSLWMNTAAMACCYKDLLNRSIHERMTHTQAEEPLGCKYSFWHCLLVPKAAAPVAGPSLSQEPSHLSWVPAPPHLGSSIRPDIFTPPPEQGFFRSLWPLMRYKSSMQLLCIFLWVAHNIRLNFILVQGLYAGNSLNELLALTHICYS